MTEPDTQRTQSTSSEWKRLQERLRCRYTMQEEVEMFDALLAGADIKQAVQRCEAQRRAKAT